MVENIKIIEYLKSGLSVQTHIGCPMGCGYFIVPGFYDSMEKVRKLSDINYAVDQLLAYKYYDKRTSCYYV